MISNWQKQQRTKVVKLLRSATKFATTARLAEKVMAPSALAAIALQASSELERISRDLKQIASDLGFQNDRS